MVVLTLTGRVSDVGRMLGERFASAMLPSLAHLVGEGRDDRVRGIVPLVTRSAARISAVVVAAAVAVNGLLMARWVGSDLYGGPMLSLLLGLANCAGVLSTASAQALFALGAVRDTARGFAVEAAIRLPSQLLSAQILGLAGIPLGAVAASLVGSYAWFGKALADAMHTARDGAREIARWQPLSCRSLPAS